MYQDRIFIIKYLCIGIEYSLLNIYAHGYNIHYRFFLQFDTILMIFTIKPIVINQPI